MKPSTLVLLAAAGLAVPTTAGAGSMPEEGRQVWLQSVFGRMDRNANGKVTRDELTAHMALRFKSSDGDSDGVLSFEEYALSMMEPIRRHMERSFAQLDRDRDGRITRSELDHPLVQSFSRLDGDGNGIVTLEELRNAAPAP